MSAQPAPAYTLTIKALPHRLSPEQRLKGILKRTLRDWRFTCTSCKPADKPKERTR